MATVKVYKPRIEKVTKRKFVMVSHVGNMLALPRAPRVTEFSSIGQEWSESARAGRESVMRRTGKKTKEFSISIELGVTDRTKTVKYQLKNLEDWANTVKPVRIIFTSNETGYYHITDFSYTVNERRESDNEPSRASVTLSFRRAVTESIKIGAIKRPVKKKPTPKKKYKPKAKPKPKAKKKKVRTHKMRKGDTLWDLARKYYGNSNKWKKLADANKIKNVRKIPIGKVIKIP